MLTLSHTVKLLMSAMYYTPTMVLLWTPNLPLPR